MDENTKQIIIKSLNKLLTEIDNDLSWHQRMFHSYDGKVDTLKAMKFKIQKEIDEINTPETSTKETEF